MKPAQPALKLDYMDYTKLLMQSMKREKTKIESIVKKTVDVRGMLQMTLNGKQLSNQYINLIMKNKNLRKIFDQFRIKLQSHRDQLNLSTYQDIVQKTIQLLIKKMQQIPQQNIQNYSKFNSFNNELKQNNLFKRVKTDNDDLYKQVQSSQHQNGINKNHSKSNISFQRQQMQMKQKIMNKNNNETEHIDCKEIEIEIRYNQSAVDLQYYQSEGYLLKKYLHRYIEKFLNENIIKVIRQSKQILIMEHISYSKSKQAGNYRYNHFLDSLEIWLIKKQQKFTRTFQLSHIDNPTIKHKPIQKNQWTKNTLTLKAIDPIQKLIQFVCEKRQAQQKIKIELAYKLKISGGVNIIQDLFNWQKSDYSGNNLMTTYIFQIQQIVEQIKDGLNIQKDRAISTEKQQCIKAANSHIILRYSIYQLGPKEKLKEVPWINLNTVKKVINIIKKQFYNDQILDQIQDFFIQYALKPDGKPISFSKGLILFGPPGTGKTVLTQLFPQLIGFRLIQKGLSAADFSKTYVGQSSRMVQSLFNRALDTPYILCSIAIDEIDGLLPDRKDSQQKNKGEATSMFLSVIGGNKDVSNLIVLASTNYLKKIDLPVRRRLNTHIQSSRLDPKSRQIILNVNFKYFLVQENKILLNLVVKITTNFTGAAMWALAHSFKNHLKLKQMEKLPIKFGSQEILKISSKIAKQFNIDFGVFTLPQIYLYQSNKKFSLSQKFLNRISKSFLLIKHQRQKQYHMLYANQIQKQLNGQLIPFYQKCIDKFHLQYEKIDVNADNNQMSDQNDFSYDRFIQSVKATFNNNKFKIIVFKSSDSQSYINYKAQIIKFLRQQKKQRDEKNKIILIIQDYKGHQGDILFSEPQNVKRGGKMYEKQKSRQILSEFNYLNRNVSVIYYLQKNSSLDVFGSMIFESDNYYYNSYELSNIQNYTGRIFVQLNEEPRMAFQLNNNIEAQSKIAFKLLLKSQDCNSTRFVIPQLIQFFTKQNANFMLLIDYQLLLQNNAFDEKKILQILEEKMMEAYNYDRAVIIIDLESLIIINQNTSDSNFGRNKSYSIQNHNLYQIIRNYMKCFALISKNKSRWMTVIAKHPELIKIAKNSLDWPKYPQQIQKLQEQKALQNQRRCVRCKSEYTQKTNRQQKKCMQHLGPIIDVENGIFINEQSVGQLRRRIVRQKIQNPQKRFLFSCCWKNYNEQGEYAYCHIEQHQLDTVEDQLSQQKMRTADKWLRILEQQNQY